MLYLKFKEGQGLGNQLWNYVALRSISEKLGYDYRIINPKLFKGNNFLNISFSSNNDIDNFNPLSKIKLFNEKIYYDNELKTFVSDYDSRILKLKPNTLIDGLFQSEKYLFGKNIKKYISLKPLNENNNSKKNLKNRCILNVRGGEYKRFKNLILPKVYWTNAIKNMKKLYPKISFSIVTDDYEYASRILPKYKIIKGDIQEDFRNLMMAKYLIISNSSFSYFPIKLGIEPKIVIAPANWARHGNLQNKWISPANFYLPWSYQNTRGELISTANVKNTIKYTKHIYSEFNVLTTKEVINKKKISNLLPIRIKKIIKKILSKIFPLHIG